MDNQGTQFNVQPPMGTPAPVQPQYPKSCLSAAWEDVKNSDGYMGKCAFLALIECVPILNFVVCGYLLEWAKEVPYGGRTPLPQKCVTGRNFEIGFYAIVLALVASVVTTIVGGVLEFFIIVGAFLTLVLAILLNAFVSFAQFRMAMRGSLGDGFQLDRIWKTIGKNWGEFLLVGVVPNLIGGLIVGLIWGVFLVVALIALLPVIVGAAGVSTAPELIYQFAGVGLGMGLILFIAMLAVLYVSMLVEVMIQMLTFRAVGHFIGRYAGEWTVS